MKELSIEEKAKAYDEAKARMSIAYNDNRCTISFMNEIFHEFKESEDERIRKELLNYLYDVHDDDEERARWIAWLEKQGEHANFLNKIQIGDKVTRNEDGVLVNLSQLNRVAKPSEKQGELRSVDFALYNDLKPWEMPKYIINAINKKRVEPVLKGEALHKFKNELNSLKQILHLLYDYGNPIHYRLALHWAFWGAYNLKDCFGMSEKEINKMDDIIGEQKAADTEVNLVDILKHYPKETELYSPLYGKLWLAEVDCKNGIITCYKQQLDNECTRATLEQEATVSFYSDGTTGLPDFTITKECMLFLYEQNPAWSEEDEMMWSSVLQDLQNIKDNNPIVNIAPEFNWLKSLKERYTWKPNGEQMRALNTINVTGGISYVGQGQDLINLYNDLKKLKG